MWTLTLALHAYATPCPADVFTGEPPQEPTAVTLVAVSSDDAWAPESGPWIDRPVTLTNAERTGACWYGGHVSDGQDEAWLYQGAFRLVHPPLVSEDRPPQPPDRALTGNTIASETTRRPATAPTTSATCPPGATTGGDIPSGASAKIIAVHPNDPAYPDWPHVIGTVGVTEGPLTAAGGCWYAGVLRERTGARHRFDRVAVWRSDAPVVPTDRRLDGPRVPARQRVRVVALAEDDAYYPERAAIIGTVCTTEGPLRRQAPGFYSGELRCENRRVRYFLKVAVALAGPNER